MNLQPCENTNASELPPTNTIQAELQDSQLYDLSALRSENTFPSGV